MKRRHVVFLAALAAGLAGCGTPPPATNGSAQTDVPPAGSYYLWVESKPTGATVVLEGIPQGRTPLRLTVPGTRQGFFRSDLSIAVRFIATDAAHLSATSTEQFSATDRIPVRLIFTPADVQRIR